MASSVRGRVRHAFGFLLVVLACSLSRGLPSLRASPARAEEKRCAAITPARPRWRSASRTPTPSTASPRASRRRCAAAPARRREAGRDAVDGFRVAQAERQRGRAGVMAAHRSMRTSPPPALAARRDAAQRGCRQAPPGRSQTRAVRGLTPTARPRRNRRTPRPAPDASDACATAADASES